MQVSEFDYELPDALIAQHPLPLRDLSRMMVVDRERRSFRHAHFSDLPEYFAAGDALVVNETRVIPARIWGRKDRSRIEFLFVRPLGEDRWEVLCRPARRVRRGDRIVFSSRLAGEVIEIGPEGSRILRFSGQNVRAVLQEAGYAPLPPYIKRRPEQTHLKAADLDRYQTVFAREEGSIAAPTAGLHFTPAVLDRMDAGGVHVIPVCLEVGPATFQPVRTEQVEEHAMLEERYSVSQKSSRLINRAREESRPVTAVGTTVVRTLESAGLEGQVHPGQGSTGLFIYPGFRFRIVDRLLTNFHLPRSTLLMLTAAFGGTELILNAYREAVRREYRFFSYGDCMLIL